MKKAIALVIAAAMMLCAATALADIEIGQTDYAAHGTKCFAVLTVAVDGETIVAAHIDEFQPMDAAAATGVPNGETIFPDLAAGGQVLGSKRVNNGLYSTNMKGHAGATQPLGVSYDAIEAYVVGKTITELEAELEGKTSQEMVDAVSGSTLADTLGYLTGLLEAAKEASVDYGYYTIYNKTGEKAVVSIADAEAQKATFELEADEAKVIMLGGNAETDAFQLLFTTESGYEAAFETLHIETTAITLLAQDALTGATPISFFAPAE